MKTIHLKVKNKQDITETLQNEINNNYLIKIKIIIPKGTFIISKTIKIHSNTFIEGDGIEKVLLRLDDKTNNNMFTNSDHNNGNSNISFNNININGNSANQFKPKEEKRLSFCNFFYFKNTAKLSFNSINAEDCKQTVMHFDNCYHVNIKNLYANGMGWSGISTSGTDDIVAKEVHIIDSGKETVRSAVHLNGGVGSYLDCKIEDSTGNGIMLDSNHSPLSKCIVKAECIKCLRGISLSGDHTNLLSNVLIKNSKIVNSDIGIMASNAKHIFIDDCEIIGNKVAGVLLQGKYGGNEVVINSSKFIDNKVNLQEIHESKLNYFTNNNISEQSKYFSAKHKEKENEIQDCYSGNCSVCNENTLFIYSGGSIRESYRCEVCSASMRERGQAQVITDCYGNGETSMKELSNNKTFKKLNIYEPGIIGPLRKYFKPFKSYNQSFYWEDIPLGESKDGIINQDLQNLKLDSDSIDLIITSDIFEHIRKPFIAFKEMHRVLKKGGKHIFTIPVQYPLPKKTIFRVDTSTEDDIYILPERYHGNGDGGRSLVYTDFGEDMLHELEKIGLKTEYFFTDKGHHLRQKNITFVSTKE